MITLYFHCTPKELFQVEDIPKGKIIQGHPMREWLDYRLEFPIQEMLEMTPAQLDESGKFLKELKARKD